ncbi:hypothetical protein [Streptomyces subrutilus]|uniref:hypothetical protein n=1 Tax=Streptomyces subrutilus TaxID=36818 RepID=UPI003D7686BE
MTSPAPSRPRPEDEGAEPELRTDTERVDAGPDRARESRPDTERRDADERAEAEERAEPCDPCEPVDPRDPADPAEPVRPPDPAEPRAALVIPVGGDTSSSAPPATEPIGASPQVSQ